MSVRALTTTNTVIQRVTITTTEVVEKVVEIPPIVAALACIRVAEEMREGVIVTVFPDSGVRYLDETFWEETHSS